jgi:hypothetical protein
MSARKFWTLIPGYFLPQAIWYTHNWLIYVGWLYMRLLFGCMQQVNIVTGSQWLRSLRRGSTAARLLELWVRIQQWLYVFQVEVFATGWSLIQRSPAECGVSDCALEALIMRPSPIRDCCAMGGGGREKNYCDGTKFQNIRELRWHHFRKQSSFNSSETADS